VLQGEVRDLMVMDQWQVCMGVCMCGCVWVSVARLTMDRSPGAHAVWDVRTCAGVRCMRPCPGTAHTRAMWRRLASWDTTAPVLRVVRVLSALRVLRVLCGPQASLMRALAGLQLRTDPTARAAVEQRYELGEEEEGARGEKRAGGGGGSQDEGGEGGGEEGGEEEGPGGPRQPSKRQPSKRQRRRARAGAGGKLGRARPAGAGGLSADGGEAARGGAEGAEG
jgi:hypothetical protein